MTEELKDLCAQYDAMSKALSAKWDAIVAVALAEYPFKVGDRVRVTRHGKTQTGQITRISVKMRGWRMSATDGVQCDPEIYPIKKNGSVAKVGQIFVWDFKSIEKLEAAE